MASDSVEQSPLLEASVEKPVESSSVANSANKTVVVSVPGSTMLFGEHSVLYGGAAVACAMDARLTVAACFRQDRRLVITSALGDYDGDLDDLEENHTHRFVLAMLRRWGSRLKRGLELTITSGFSHTVGLGSSAALTVAVAAVLRQLSGLPFKQRALLDECLAAVREVQGSGSGTDIVASIYGGVVHYRPDTRSVTSLGKTLPVDLYYCGYKTPTPEVIARVKEQRLMTPSLYDSLYRMMGDCTQQGTGAIREGNLERLGRCMNVYHGLMDGLGVCDQALANMVYQLRGQGALGAKISGSGLGDCVVGLRNDLSAPALVLPDYERLSVTVSESGVRFESDAK